jgi:hypothetical protein
VSKPLLNPYLGTWTYRSLQNDPDITIDLDKLEIRRAILVIDQDETGALTGTIGGPGAELTLYGGFGFGAGEPCRFRASGTVEGVAMVLDFFALRAPVWPNSTPAQQRPTLIGSVTRVISHTTATPGVIAPAGMVGSFYAVKQG